MRPITLLILALLAACSAEGASDNGAESIDESSMSGIFLNAMFDELRGPPDASALSKRAKFDQGGVRFDYPQPLRVRIDRDPYMNWSLEYGDFEMELHAPDSDFMVDDYLDALAGTLGAKSKTFEGPLNGRTVHWCGQEITGTRYRFEFLGDQLIYEGFDLPANGDGPRFLIFNETGGKTDWSPTAMATFEAIDGSISCSEDKAPGPESEE